MKSLEQWFRLGSEPGVGVSCDEAGLFVGETPVLARNANAIGLDQWRPRALVDLNRDLGDRYGLPIDCTRKMAGFEAIARALGRGDVAHARIVALHLRLPDPPDLAKATSIDQADLAMNLGASGLLKAGWDPAKHPRWPANSSGGVGGEFAPADGEGSPAGGASPVPLRSAQLAFPGAIPFPETLPAPGAIPFPSEILTPPIVAPNIHPREATRNPYPDRPECVEEWAHAMEYCGGLLRRGLLGKGDYRKMGKTFRECVMGQVSESCGGNSVLV